MLTDLLIFLDYLEDYNQNTSFLRFITPITFAIIETHYYNCTDGYGSSYGNDFCFGYSYGDAYGYSYGNGIGYDYSYGNGNGYGFGYVYSNTYDEEH